MPSGQGQVAFLSPKMPYRPPSLSSQSSLDRGPLRFRVDRVSRPRAGCVLSAPPPSTSASPHAGRELPPECGDTGYSPLASRAGRSAQRHGWASPPPPQATEPMGVTRQGPSSQEWAERQQERHAGSRTGQPAWLRLRPAAPHQFSGNSPSQRGRNPEPGQWVSGWLHSLRSVYQPLCAPAVEAGSGGEHPSCNLPGGRGFPKTPGAP